ncbi:MAG: AAA family ATPase [Lachnospiraceae bacterium]|nr:AAA family ATPase [Lachnospiraceae bacterium]
MKHTTVICFTNNKGGSGKSTTCSNVGYGLMQLGNKVLFIDGDMQLNLSLSFFEEEQVLELASGEKNLYQGIRMNKDLTDYIVHTKYENLDLIPSSTLMSSIEYELFTKWQREFILKKGIEKIKAEGIYDYILIDAPPTLGGWVMNILIASDYVIVPVEASPWGLFGLGNMFDYLSEVQNIATELKLLGIAVTKVDTRKNYFKQTMETLQSINEVRVFDSYVRVDSAVEWAQDNCEPVIAYKKSSRSAKEYMALAEEIDTLIKGLPRGNA